MVNIFHIFWDKGGKYLSVSFHPHLFSQRKFCHKTNGAVKGIDNCLDSTWWLFGLRISYTNFNFWRYRNDCMGRDYDSFEPTTKEERLKYKCGKLFDLVETVHGMLEDGTLKVVDDGKWSFTLKEDLDEEVETYHRYMIDTDLQG